jgi:cholesterol transport system auxiliary component
MSRLILPTLDRRALLLGGVAVVVAGCGNIIGPPEASQFYKLEPELPGTSGGPRVGWSLAVMLPDTADALDSNRIAISRSPQTLDYFADAVWPDRLTELVQMSLVQAFEKSGRIEQVSPDTAGLHADVMLQTQIIDFEARYDQPDGAPTAVVKIEAKLVTNRTREIMSHLTASQEAAANANSIPAAVDALDRAFGAVLGQIVGWALSTPVRRAD